MSSAPRPPASAIVLGFVGGLGLIAVAFRLDSLLAGLAGLGLMIFALTARSSATDAERDELARALDDARVLPQGDEVIIDGLHRGERVWLVRTSAVPGTLCRVECAAAPTLRGTIKAGQGGGPPQFVGGPTSALPAALSSVRATQALRTVLERCPFVRIRAEQVEVLVEDAGAVPTVLGALTVLTHVLRDEAAPAPVRVDLRARAQLSADCPYCREALGGSEPMACAQCGTQHHVECFLEHGRCTVLACGGGATPSRVRDA